ncbi:MAG: hypothetical protein AVDCRST_MAG11-3319 [uncultured Gemmatimonadaceae bacterium]|uniref:Uncharacterized protein n=1 Tax=uncultured Gemmatimonadaceae bacterium TaxID=246130 RepID=A0A6J4M1U0_9BACT|nr:MAG: hypothetical protein AVDCRST_MAG11-3319 [uncultured Gemmatimonadaceae bacterium]
MPPATARALLRNLELILTAAGLGVIAAVPAVLRPTPERYWTVVAATAVGVGVVHGVLFWLVRRRQREVRAATLRDARDVLTDVVNNKLQLMLVHLEELHASASARAPDPVDLESLVAARDAAAHVSALLTTLSEESLRSWKARYPALAPGR